MVRTIQLKKFGKVLVSRSVGLEAFKGILSTLERNAPVEIDFDGVLTVTPSWFDEFLTNLAEHTGGKVELLPTKNASVRAVLPVLGSARQDAVADIVQRALDRMTREERSGVVPGIRHSSSVS